MSEPVSEKGGVVLFKTLTRDIHAAAKCDVTVQVEELRRRSGREEARGNAL